MTFTLADDGTLDTVVKCNECGQEERFNYDGDINMTPDEIEADYHEWVNGCCEGAEEDHECNA